MIARARHQPTSAHARSQSGLSLIELMVTIVVGLILLAGLSKIFVNSKQGYRVQESAGRLQENARYAVDTLARGVRNADFWAGVTPATITLSTSTYPNGSASTCKDGFIINPVDAVHGYAGASTPPNSIDCSGNMSSNYVPNSDILMLRYADPDQWYPTTAGVPSGTSAVCSASTTQGPIFLRAATGKTGIIFNQSQCAATTAALPGDANLAGVLNYRYAFQMFWLRKCSTLPSTGICTSTSDGGKPIPSLVVTDLSSSGTNDEVVAEGIEMMKIDYGVDTDGDGSVDHYYTAGAVTNWSQVLTVRIGLIVRGDTLDTYQDTDTYNMPSGYAYTVTDAASKNYQRRLVVKELMVRNRVRRG